MTKNFCDICNKQLPGPAPKAIAIATKAGIDRNGSIEIASEGVSSSNKPIMLMLHVDGEYCPDCKRVIVANLIMQCDMPGMGAKKFGA